ncbi:Protein patched/dispatched, partial [Trinorchestia longiramus]
RHGRSVAQRPVLYIVFCLLFTGLCSLGFFNFYMESRPEKLWIPQNSDFVTALEWQKEEFPNTVRIEMVLYEADNVLTPVVVQEMYRIYKEVADIKVEDQFGVSKNQTNLCFRVPVSGKSTNVDLKGEKSGGLAVQTDWSVVLKDQIYCGVLALIPKECLQLGILELWGDNPAVIQALTQQDIINDINTANLSATYLYPLNFTEFLGGIERNSSGHIVSARAAMHQWMMAVNRTAVNLAYFEDMSGLTSAVDPGLYRWEGEFIKVLLNDSLRPDGVAVYASSERSFGEISENTIMGDVTFLIAGNVILYIYVTLMLGRFNLVEQRPLLSLIGLFSTSLAVLISFGLCSACGLDYGPVHSILPLLLLGLGVDDMFVIVQCWTNLPEQ